MAVYFRSNEINIEHVTIIDLVSLSVDRQANRMGDGASKLVARAYCTKRMPSFERCRLLLLMLWQMER